MKDSNITKLNHNINQIKKHLMELEGNETVADLLANDFINHPDIAEEYEYWLRTKSFKSNNPICENGYTAQMLYQKFGMQLDINGIFSLLLELRTNPEEALNKVNNGINVK